MVNAVAVLYWQIWEKGEMTKNQGECKKVAGTLVAVWDLRGGRNKKRQWSCYNSLWQCPACVWVRSPLQSGVSGWTLFIISVVSRSVRGNCTRDTGEYIVLSCLNCYIHYLITIFTSSSTCYWTVSTRLGDDPLNDIKLSCAHGSYYVLLFCIIVIFISVWCVLGSCIWYFDRPEQAVTFISAHEPVAGLLRIKLKIVVSGWGRDGGDGGDGQSARVSRPRHSPAALLRIFNMH